MTDAGSSGPARRTFQAGRLSLVTTVVVITLPIALICSLVIGLLLALRPLIVVALGFATVGGLAAGSFFACVGDWPNVAEAGLIASLSGSALAGYVALADRFGFTGSEAPSMVPPWWWHL